MPRGPRFIFKNSIYHLYNRGLNKQPVFLAERDYQFFLNRLRKLKNKYDHVIYACVLMPNHFHLTIRTRNTPLSKIMSSLLTSYSMYFNKAHGHLGPIWQNRYQSILIENDYYLWQLLKYIYQNPIKDGLSASLSSYPYSTLSEALGQKPLDVLDGSLLELLNKSFPSVEEFKNFIEEDLIDLDTEKIKQLLEKESPVSGSNLFTTRANRKYLTKRFKKR